MVEMALLATYSVCNIYFYLGGLNLSKAVITSYTLLDFMSEADMNGFFSFVESNMEPHAANLRANGMTKFYISRVFNKGDKSKLISQIAFSNEPKLKPLFK